MVSPAAPDRHQTPIDPPSSPRISFSTDFLDDTDFISISPNPSLDTEISSNQILKSPDFEFLSNKGAMLTADELFFEGKFLPFRQTPAKIALKSSSSTDEDKTAVKAPLPAPEPRIWFIDDDPSPRPPKCTVLWKELLRLRKQKAASASASAASSLSPSSSTSSSSSSSSSSLGDHVAAMEEAKGPATAVSTREKHIRRIKKGLERTKSAANIRIRPMVNVPVCTPNVNKNSSLPPLFPLKKGKGRSLIS